MQRLAERYPGDTRYRNHVALALNNLGKLQLAEGNLDTGTSYLSQALRTWDELLQDEPYRMDYRERVASLYWSIAEYFSDSIETEKALKLFHRSIELTRELVSLEPQIPEYRDELGRRYNSAGEIYQDIGKHDEALGCYLEAIKAAEELCNEYPGHRGYQERHTLYLGKAESLFQVLDRNVEGKEDPAGPPAKEEGHAAAAGQQVAGKIVLFKKLKEEAGICQDSGEMEKAVALFNRCMGLLHEMMPLMEDQVPLKRNQALIYNHLCLLYLQKDEVEEALSHFKKSMALLTELHRENPENQDVHGDLKDGWLFASTGLLPFVHREVSDHKVLELWQEIMHILESEEL